MAGDIRVDWVNLDSVPGLREAPGKIGMTFLPGKWGHGIAGEHRRDLEADVSRLRDFHGVDEFLLLVEEPELVRARVSAVSDVIKAHSIELMRLPIPDGGVPANGAQLAEVLNRLSRSADVGRKIVVACMGGLGRTGTVVACLLKNGGLGSNEAIALTRASRHGTIENDLQEGFVRAWRFSVVSDHGLAPPTIEGSAKARQMACLLARSSSGANVLR